MATAVHISSFQDLAQELSAVPEVTKIFFHQFGREVNVWTVVPGFDRSVRDKIYKIEQSLRRHSPDFHLNFRVVANESEIGDSTLIFDRAA